MPRRVWIHSFEEGHQLSKRAKTHGAFHAPGITIEIGTTAGWIDLQPVCPTPSLTPEHARELAWNLLQAADMSAAERKHYKEDGATGPSKYFMARAEERRIERKSKRCRNV